MSHTADTNKDGTVFKCPFCLYYDGNESTVRSHITSENDALHKGRNGYELDRSLEETHPDVEYNPDNGNSMKDTRDAILDIGSTIEPLEKEDIDSLAEELDISNALLFRILDDEGIEYNWGYGKPQYYADNLTDKTLKVLYTSIKEGTDDPDKVSAKVENYFGENGETYYPSTLEPILEKKSWMATRRYKEEVVQEVENRQLLHDKTDEMLDNAREYGIVGADQDEDEEDDKEEPSEESEEEEDVADQPEELAEQAEELLEEQDEEGTKGPTEEGKRAAVITCDQDQLFEIVMALRAAGNDELAKQLFREGIGETLIGVEVIDWDEA